MMIYNSIPTTYKKTEPAAAPVNNSHAGRDQEPAARDPQRNQLRHNPRLVIGGLDYFDLLMEQDEQQ